MAKFSDEDLNPAMNPAREGAESGSADLSDTEDLEQYGVWVKAGPEDLGGDEWDDEFEISDLGGSEDSDLLTDEEEKLLSELEETVPADTAERTEDIHGLDTGSDDLFTEGETIILPDLSEDELTIPSFDETPQPEREPLDEIFPEEELVSLESDLEIEESAEQVDDFAEPDTAEETAPEVFAESSDAEQLISEEPLPDISFTPEETLSETEFSFDTGSDPASGAETHESADESESEFTEISLDEFADFSTGSEDEEERTDDSEQGEDFFDLDLDLDAAEPEDAGESIFTDEELDDFFGVPIEDFSAQEESSSPDAQQADSAETTDLSDLGTEAADEEAGDSETIGLEDFPSFEVSDPVLNRSVDEEVRTESAGTAEDETGLPDIDSLSFMDDSIPPIEAGIEPFALEPESDQDNSEILPELQAEDVDEVEEVDAIEESMFEEEPETIPQTGEPSGTGSVLDETIESVEREIRDAKAGESLEASILLKIERELATIKSELSELKQELSALRGQSSGGEAVSENGAESAGTVSGFFDDDEDDTIALTGDELDNILNTADITEENVGEPEEEPSIDLSAEPEQETAFDERSSDEFISREDDLIPLEDESEQAISAEAEAESESVEIDEVEEASIPSEDLMPEDDLLQDVSDEVSAEESDLELQMEESDGDPTDEPVIAPLEFEAASEQPAESGEELMPEFEDLDPEALALDTEEEPELSEEEAEEEPETAFDEAVEPTEEDNLSIDELTMDGQDGESEEELRLFDEPLSEDLVGEDASEAETESEEQPPFEELSLDSFSTDDAQPETDEDLEPADQESGDTVPADEAEGQPAVEDSLKDEIKSVLSYMDTLLDALPEEKIQEFARSEHFEVYRKLFEELGLGK